MELVERFSSQMNEFYFALIKIIERSVEGDDKKIPPKVRYGLLYFKYLSVMMVKWSTIIRMQITFIQSWEAEFFAKYLNLIKSRTNLGCTFLQTLFVLDPTWKHK